MAKATAKKKPITRRAAKPTEDFDGDGDARDATFTVTTPTGRFSYPYVASPDTGREFSDEKYKSDLLVDKKEWKKSPAVKELKDQMLACAQAKWGKKIKTLEDVDQLPFYDMDEKDNVSEKVAGTICIRAKSKFSVKCIGPDKRELTEKEIDAIKGGDWGRFVVACNAYLQKGEKGINLYLNLLQFKQKGEPLGDGHAAALEMVDEYEVEMEDPEEDEEEENEEETRSTKSKSAGRGRGRKAEPDEDDNDEEEEEAEEDEDEKPAKKTRSTKSKRSNSRSSKAHDDDQDEDDEEEEDEPRSRKRPNGRDEKFAF